MALKVLYDEIEHPTVGDFVRMILNFYDAEKEKDPSVKWEDLRIYTTDLRGANNLISWKASDVRKFGVGTLGVYRYFLSLWTLWVHNHSICVPVCNQGTGVRAQ
jgi:hypothetical protein